MSEEDIVYFNMPDGTKVSNDPRFDMNEVREEMLAAKPNTGDIGIKEAEQKAQTQVEHLANLQSAQPGVGQNPAPEDPHDYIPNTGTPAMARQTDDLQTAKDAGADLTETSVQDAEPVDSNQAVQDVRDQAEEERKAAQEAAEQDSDDEIPDDDDYGNWKGAQLKAEVKRRNKDRDDEDRIDTSGVTRKAQLADLLHEDDQRNA